MNTKDEELICKENLEKSNKIISYYEKEEDKLVSSIKLNCITIDNINNFKKANKKEMLKLILKIAIISGTIIAITKLLGTNPNLLGVTAIVTCFNLPRYFYKTNHNRNYIRKNNITQLINKKDELEQELSEIREKKQIQEKYNCMISDRLNKKYQQNTLTDTNQNSNIINKDFVRIRK